MKTKKEREIGYLPFIWHFQMYAAIHQNKVLAKSALSKRSSSEMLRRLLSGVNCQGKGLAYFVYLSLNTEYDWPSGVIDPSLFILPLWRSWRILMCSLESIVLSILAIYPGPFQDTHDHVWYCHHKNWPSLDCSTSYDSFLLVPHPLHAVRANPIDFGLLRPDNSCPVVHCPFFILVDKL